MIDSDKCPICGIAQEIGTDFCNQCGWESRHYFIPLTGEFLELEQRRLSIARRNWQSRSQQPETTPASDNTIIKEPKDSICYSYGILVSYRGEECVSNMIFRNDPKEIKREWPSNKFKTQSDNQSSITLPIYRNLSEERIVPINQCEKVINSTITLGNNVPQGTPINISLERDKDNIIILTVSCLNKETIVRL